MNIETEHRNETARDTKFEKTAPQHYLTVIHRGLDNGKTIPESETHLGKVEKSEKVPLFDIAIND